MKKNKSKKYLTQGEMLLHISNPMHLEACKMGGRVFRDRSKYTRKAKHKKSLDY